MKFRYQRTGQIWSQNDLTLLVLGINKAKSPVLHCLLVTDKEGKVYVAQMGEHHLRRWESQTDMRRIDV